MQKNDFLRLFWAAFTSSFTANNILSSFAATAVHPRNPHVVLNRLDYSTPEQDIDTEAREHGNGDSWRQLAKLLDAAVPDISKNKAKQVKQAFHSLQVHNELLHYENNELRAEIATKNRAKKQKKILDMQQHQEYQSPAVIWSPRSVREARAREAVKQQEEEAEKIRKREMKEIRAAAAVNKQKLLAEAKVARELAKKARQKEKEAKAAELAAARAKKEQQRSAATTKNSGNRLNIATRKTSASNKSKISKSGGVAGRQSSGAAAQPPTQPTTKTTMRGRNIKLPRKFE